MTDDMKVRILIETFKEFHHARRRTIGYCSNHVKGVGSPPVFPNNVTFLFPLIALGVRVPEWSPGGEEER
jgi:hypothetical protein